MHLNDRMNSRRRTGRLLLAAAAGIAALMTALPASQAQDYPNRTVRIIVPFPAGGTADAMPRVVADYLSRKWGQAVVIENRSGAGGNVGAEAAYKSEPDGYTLLSAPPPPLVVNHNLYPKLGFDPLRFEPIAVMGLVPNALLTNPGFPPKSVAEVIAYGKANPGKIISATQGNGTTSHLTSEMFAMMGGFKLTHVPYRGAAPALTDLVGGTANIMFDNLGVSLTQVQGGKIKLLGRRDHQAHGVAAGCADHRAKRCRDLNRPPGSRWWRHPARRSRSSRRSMPTSTRRCATRASRSAWLACRRKSLAAAPRTRQNISAARSTAGTR